MKKRCFVFLIFFLLIPGYSVHAQQSPTDSLNKALQQAKDDTTRAQLYVMLTEYYAATNIDTVVPLCEKAIAIADAGLKNADPQETKAFNAIKISAYNNIGYAYSMKDEVPRALEYYEKSKALLDLTQDKQGLANYYISVGYIYNNQGDVPKAIEFYGRSLELQEEIGDKRGAASSLNNIAVIYNRLNDTSKALEYFIRAKAMYIAVGEKIGEAAALNNMAAIYERQGDTTRAMNCYRESLAIRRAEGDQRGVGTSLSNIGVLYEKQGMPDVALRYYNEALVVREAAKDKKGVIQTLLNIAVLYKKQGDWTNAQVNAERGLELAQKIGYPENIARASEILSAVYFEQGKYKEAYAMQVLFKQMSDSVMNDATNKAAMKAQMKYTLDQREAAFKAEQDIKDAQTAEAQQRQKLIIYAISGGLVLVFLLALFILRGNRQKQRANEIIIAQKAEVEKTKLILEEKNKDVLDSLHYARRIQQAKLPHPGDIHEILPESFVLFMPKDIVSGDFYFFGKDGNYVFIAAADCTGHGVPGALMSMIGYEKLTEALAESDDVSQILRLVNKGIKTSLRQTESDESTRDGMDIALCRIDLQTHKLQYAGANRPFWCIRRGQSEIEEIRPTKNALGGLTTSEQDFEKHEVQLEDGDTFYIFSDGYADLFNGETGKKLTTKKFRQLLLETQQMDLHNQEKRLGDFAEHWRKGTEQIDDILVIGVRL